jgi:iron complex outermembrane receptor protein
VGRTTTLNLVLITDCLIIELQVVLTCTKRNTEDLLFTQNLLSLDLNFINYNVGSIENKGIEIAAEVVPVRTENLEWRIGGNVRQF